MAKKSIGLVHVKAHTRAGKRVKSYTRSGGAMSRTLGRKAKSIKKISEVVHAVGNPLNRSLNSIIKEHQDTYAQQAKYIRRGIDRSGYKGGGKMGYLISAAAVKKIKTK